MTITGTLASEESGSGQRASERLLLRLDSRGVTTDGEVAPILIHNLSETGLLIETKLDLPLDKQLLVELPELGEVPATVVWQSDKLIGCQFDQPISPAVLSAAQLRNPIQHGLDLDELASTAPFGERLKYLRERRGLSRSGLAALTGLSAPTLWSWETGKTQPRRKGLCAVAAALDVDADELLYGQKPSSADAKAETKLGATSSDAGRRGEELMRASKEAIAFALGVRLENVKIIVEF